jgi:ParB-like nuclease domain
VNKPLTAHPVAKLFPDMSEADFAALVEDIRQHGVKLPVLVYEGQILDGRHRYQACQKLGVPCPTVTWNGRDPWWEVQSRNLVRRHLSKEQVCAIRKLASEQFAELSAPIESAKARAKQRKAQAKGQPRGRKALSRSQGSRRESADEIGAYLGVSGTTVKRVDRLAREAPQLLAKVAAGELSVKKALREAGIRDPRAQARKQQGFMIDWAIGRLERAIWAEWSNCPQNERQRFLRSLQQLLRELLYDYKSESVASEPVGDKHRGALHVTEVRVGNHDRTRRSRLAGLGAPLPSGL